jgi:hypothetical protein
MVNRGEPLRTVVMYSKPKRLRGLDQKGREAGPGAPHSPDADGALPAARRDLPHPGTPTERGQPVVVPLGRWFVRTPSATAGTGGGRKRTPCCNGVERDWNSIPRASGQTSLWSLGTRNRGQPLQEAKQMTAAERCWCGLPRQRVSAPGQYRTGVSMLRRRVPQGAFERLERHAWKHACAVLRGGGGGNIISLPDRTSEVSPW